MITYHANEHMRKGSTKKGTAVEKGVTYKGARQCYFFF